MTRPAGAAGFFCELVACELAVCAPEGEGILKICWQDWQRADFPAAESGTLTAVWQDGHFVRIGMRSLSQHRLTASDAYRRRNPRLRPNS